MNRKYPISEIDFNREVLPIIENNYIWKGRPVKVSHYKVFSGILYVLRTGISWRDLPEEYGSWHNVYQRFRRGSEKGLWWKILSTLQARKLANIEIVMIDSSTIKLHRQGGGVKGGFNAKEKALEG